jgi:hypothetical protein
VLPRPEEEPVTMLFGDDMIDRPRPELPEGAEYVPGWLTLEQQRWIVARFHEWVHGPVPIRAAKVRGHEMSVRTVCLGWHWRPYVITVFRRSTPALRRPDAAWRPGGSTSPCGLLG